MFGQEEQENIKLFIHRLAEQGWQVFGLVSADTVYLRAINGEFDVVVATYHDQGHIPSKLVGFHNTVNVTLRLPINRTSVDHGTTYDVAGTSKADEGDLLAAITFCANMTSRSR